MIYSKRITMAIIAVLFSFGLGVDIGNSIVSKDDTTEPVIVVTTEPMVKLVLDKKPVVDCGLSEELQNYIYDLCNKKNISYTLVLGLIEAESGFDADIISNTNDYGLMQINSINHKFIAENYYIVDVLNPKDNVTAGILMLSTLYEKYNDTNKVLMAYHYGERGASELWEQGIFETGYVTKILENKQKWEGEIDVVM